MIDLSVYFYGLISCA